MNLINFNQGKVFYNALKQIDCTINHKVKAMEKISIKKTLDKMIREIIS